MRNPTINPVERAVLMKKWDDFALDGRLQWEYHRLEELMDACVYSMRIIEIIESEMDDGK